MLERIVLVGDIHSNAPALDPVLTFKEDKLDPHVTGIFSTGDDSGYGLYIKATLEIKMDSGIKSVMGDHDMAIAHGLNNIPDVTKRYEESIGFVVRLSHKKLKKAGKEYLDHLGGYPATRNLKFGGRDIIISHNNPKYVLDFHYYVSSDEDTSELFEWMRAQKPQYDISVIGHTHKQLLAEADYSKGSVEQNVYRINTLDKEADNNGWDIADGEGFSTYRYKLDPNKKYIINPGSVGQTRDGIMPHASKPRAAFAYLENDDGELSVVFVQVDYNVNGFIRKFKELNFFESLKRLIGKSSFKFPEDYIERYRTGT